MSYIALSDDDRRAMLAAVGIASVDELFCCIPEEIRAKKDLDLPAPLSEPELVRHFRGIAARNRTADVLSFLGAGA